jgi:S1-C subfamily serine protease
MKRTLLITLWIAALMMPALAQRTHRPATTTPPSDGSQTKPVVSRVHVGLVYVLQTIDLKPELGGEEQLMTLDGEPAPPLRTKNVTVGLVIDNEGHIVTRLAAPPIAGAISGARDAVENEILVRTERASRPYKAQFIGMDSATGLCLLQTEEGSAQTLQQAEFESPSAQPLAESNPKEVQVWGFHPRQGQSRPLAMTVFPRINESSGRIVKATHDFRYSAQNSLYYLLSPQLSAVQDGSLVVADGTVFGIAVFETGGKGYNLIYPISRVRDLAKTLARSKTNLAHGWLGAMGVDMYTPIKAGATPAPVTTDLGVRVTAVIPDSPADKAGVRAQDILLAVNDHAVGSVAQLTSALRQIPGDCEVTLKIKRRGEYKFLQAILSPAPALDDRQQVTVLAKKLDGLETELGSLQQNDPRRQELEPKVTSMRTIMDGLLRPAPVDVKLRVLFGVEVQPLTEQLAKYFAVPNGVLTSAVLDSNRSARAGLKPGDVIVKAGDREVSDAASLLKILEDSKSGSVDLLISRHGEQSKVQISR